ncbi:MAG: DUF2470 domain-containing protein [Bdellovibrionales bacterium]|nr:DUF2470 domain-containing protein [Bdellovibrionales bacterium]
MNIRNQVTANNSAILSTISQKHDGYPFGSVVPYDVDEQGRPVIYISTLAEHYKNLSVSTKASLTLVDPFGHRSPQAHWRITLLCSFMQVAEEEHTMYRESYLSRFPSAKSYQETHDFFFFRGEVQGARWIEGFGSMGWCSAEEYTSEFLDPLSYDAPVIVAHMNADHADVLERYVRLYLPEHVSLLGPKTSVVMTSISRESVFLRIFSPSKEVDCSIPLPQRVNTSSEAREMLIGMLQR